MNYYNKLVKYSGYLASALFITIGFIVSYEVIMRYLFNSPTIWVNEVSRFLQIWATYLALTYSFHKSDFIRITGEGTIKIFGRSDATLNPGGVRIGTAEIYRVVENLSEIKDSLAVGQNWNEDQRIILFLKMFQPKLTT